MNLYDLNNDIIIMNIDGIDIEMKPAICFGKVFDKWLVSKCGKVWSLHFKRIVEGRKSWYNTKDGADRLTYVHLDISTPLGFWGDGSGYLPKYPQANVTRRSIKKHKLVMDTWKPLYDNPPEGIVWEEWEIVRDLPTVYNHISKTIVIDHIDDDVTNNRLDNLRRVTSWDNQHSRKAKGLK